jgi:hypothetical protein
MSGSTSLDNQPPAPPKLTRPRPKLSVDSVDDYLDWIAGNLNVLGAQARLQLDAVELVIRTLTTEAQGKATQHTLVESGIIQQPGT